MAHKNGEPIEEMNLLTHVISVFNQLSPDARERVYKTAVRKYFC